VLNVANGANITNGLTVHGNASISGETDLGGAPYTGGWFALSALGLSSTVAEFLSSTNDYMRPLKNSFEQDVTKEV
jgi:hypothetical protein